MSEDLTARFNHLLFCDRQLQDELANRGFAVRECLHVAEVEALRSGFIELSSQLPDGLPNSFFPSGRLTDPRLRNLARRVIDDTLLSALKRSLLPDSFVMDGGTMLMKPSGEGTALSPHQDSSHVDESTFFSVYAWIPLSDTDRRNGALHVLPRSHLIGNRHRSLNVPWTFSGMEDDLSPHMIPVEMKAGQVCFFEGALIHSSPPNLSDEVRVAVNYVIRPSASAFLHHFVDEKTPEGMVEVYGVTIDFFYNEDFEARPPANLFLRYEEAVNPVQCRQALRRLINSRW